MDEQKQAEFNDWAIVEVMGHHRYAGYVTTQAYGQAVLFRVDVPEIKGGEFILEKPDWVGGQWCPAGTKAERPTTPGYTKLIGAGSIYAITPCTEKAALKAVESLQQRPLKLIEIPSAKALAAAVDGEHDFEIEEDDHEEEMEGQDHGDGYRR